MRLEKFKVFEKIFSYKYIVFFLGMSFVFGCTSSAQEPTPPQQDKVEGCTDPKALNFNRDATSNNGSCVYEPVNLNPVTSKILPSVIHETSGLIFYKDSLITINDDTDTNLYIFSPSNTDSIRPISINGVQNIDWEEIQQDEHYIYIGDFGNNGKGNRQNLKIYRVKKSELENNPTPEVISFAYEMQTDFSPQPGNQTNFDCEGFIVTDHKIYLFTKEWVSNKTSVYELEKSPGNQTAVLKSTYNVQGLITGAAYVKDKNLIALSGYTQLLQPFIYLLYDYKNNDFFGGNVRRIDLNMMGYQVEGIATQDGLLYYITNEEFTLNALGLHIDQQLHQLDLTEYLSDYISQ